MKRADLELTLLFGSVPRYKKEKMMDRFSISVSSPGKQR